MRVIASVYTGSTEKRAIDDLVGLGAQGQDLVRHDTDAPACQGLAVRASHRVRHCVCRVVEPDAVRFGRWARMERPADATDNADIVERIRRTFEQYWNEPEFEPYDPRVDGERLEEALAAQAQPAITCPLRYRLWSTDAEALPGSRCSRAFKPSASAAISRTSSSRRPAQARRGCPPSTTSAAKSGIRAAALRCPPRRDPATEPGRLSARAR